MEQTPLIETGLPISLFIIMVGMGLTLTTADFVREAKAPRGVILGSLAQLILMPSLGFAVAWGLGLSAAIAVGIVIVAASPGGATSNVITFLARGNVALSITLTAIASLATIVMLPLYVNMALGWQMGTNADVKLPVLETISMLMTIVLIPVGVGMLIRAKAEQLAAKLEKVVNLFGALVLLVLIVLVSYSLRDQILTLIAQSGFACLVLNALGIATGWLAARAANLPLPDAIAISVEIGIKNATIGILVAMTLLQSAEMAMPSVVYGLLMYVFGIGMIYLGRRYIPASPAVAS
ncbi:BASS family bile acid:Na+ symporter [Litorivivens lipolytica]|uniref:BASS family bile acid:Na+ symporter n=1 Tax=Litorivivens lipolytica TaxID=1524264 RepID=A0A7W4W638_9GAMM|nr:bile acid:sodium symporter family protein [Litorivivens lipolytica]MBB3048188.1 BASS family bile acid:Na+ symporter [Litorivivens lipolytica]